MEYEILNKDIVEQYMNTSIKLRKQVRIAYVDKKGKAEIRTIEPSFVKTGLTVSGYCHLRKGPRHFSLDRIVQLILLDTDYTAEDPFKKPEEAS